MARSAKTTNAVGVVRFGVFKRGIDMLVLVESCTADHASEFGALSHDSTDAGRYVATEAVPIDLGHFLLAEFSVGRQPSVHEAFGDPDSASASPG